MKELRFYYNHLSVLERPVYDAIVKGIAAHEQSIRIMGPSSAVKKVFPMVVLDCPEFFYVETSCYSVSGNGVFTILNLEYHKNMAQSRAIRQQLERIGNRFLDEVTARRMNSLATVRFAHDFIIRNVEYARENLASGDSSGDVCSITGVFLKRRAVCLGIAMGIKWLLDLAGIPSAVIEGRVRERGIQDSFTYTGAAAENNHAWNLVCLKDQWYHMDVTMDLGALPDKRQIAYDYFLRCGQLMKNYLFFLEPKVDCSLENASYFARNHVIFTDASQVRQYLAKSGKNHQKRLYFQLKGAAKDLSGQEILSWVSASVSGSYRHRYNDRLYIYDICLL